VAPLGVLAAAAVANGVFARIKLHTGWPDLQQISVDDVVALADRVQQLGSDALLRVGEVISSSPVLASSTATVLLMSLLLRAARTARTTPRTEALRPRAPAGFRCHPPPPGWARHRADLDRRPWKLSRGKSCAEGPHLAHHRNRLHQRLMVLGRQDEARVLLVVLLQCACSAALSDS
jgi:hypothetical protein